MRNTLIGVMSSVVLGAGLLAATTQARADVYGGNDIFVFGGSNAAPVFGKAYGPDAAGPGQLTQAGVCWLFPTGSPHGGIHLEEVCR